MSKPSPCSGFCQSLCRSFILASHLAFRAACRAAALGPLRFQCFDWLRPDASVSKSDGGSAWPPVSNLLPKDNPASPRVLWGHWSLKS